MNEKQAAGLKVKIPASIDKSLLIAINGGRGQKYFSAEPINPGRHQVIIEGKQGKQRKNKVKQPVVRSLGLMLR